MRSVVDDRLKEEVSRFRLRFACDDCVHFDPGTDDEASAASCPSARAKASCSQGFPTEEHRCASLEGRTDLVFCKMFEAS